MVTFRRSPNCYAWPTIAGDQLSLSAERDNSKDPANCYAALPDRPIRNNSNGRAP